MLVGNFRVYVSLGIPEGIICGESHVRDSPRNKCLPISASKMASIDELKKDLEELTKFEGEATRTRVKNALAVEIRKIESAISLQMQGSTQTPGSSGASNTSRQEPKVYTEQIKKYAWDQSDKFMKLYVSLNGVQGLPADSVVSTFDNQSVKLTVKGLNNRNYQLYIARLCEPIVPGESYHKVKTDTVLLMMKKTSSVTWAFVTEAEKKAKETKKPNIGENDDPNASLMKMMQNMYEDGDDEMKRTIAKAWSESRDKSPL